jgi:hypothetical protein
MRPVLASAAPACVMADVSSRAADRMTPGIAGDRIGVRFGLTRRFSADPDVRLSHKGQGTPVNRTSPGRHVCSLSFSGTGAA